MRACASTKLWGSLSPVRVKNYSGEQGAWTTSPVRESGLLECVLAPVRECNRSNTSLPSLQDHTRPTRGQNASCALSRPS